MTSLNLLVTMYIHNELNKQERNSFMFYSTLINVNDSFKFIMNVLH